MFDLWFPSLLDCENRLFDDSEESMKLFLYAMYDRLDGSHRSPVTGRSDSRTSKEFCDMMSNYKAQMAQKGQTVDLADFELHKLGTFDDESGAIEPLAHYEVVPLSYVHDNPSTSAPQQ